MKDPLSYFALGSLFTFGTLYPGRCLLLHIVSSISLLAFAYSRTSARNPNLKINIIGKNDLLALVCGLILEDLLVSTSAKYLRIRLLKMVAACGLSVSITVFCVALNYLAVNATDGKSIITSGPYKYARHPIYAALILYWLSCCVYLSCFISMATFFWFINSRICPRIRSEEKEMITISSEYLEYRRTVWSGIPMYKQ